MRRLKAEIAILLGTLLLPQVGNATSFLPCSYEKVELKASTPIDPVVITSMIPTELAAIAIAFEHGSPAERSDGLKQGFGLGVLFANYFIGFASGGCRPFKSNFEAPALSDDDRTSVRDGYITRTYIIAGIEMALATSLLLVAEHPTNRILAGIGIPAPLIASLIWRDRFARGPALYHKASYKPDISLRLVPNGSNSEVAPVLAASVLF